MAVFFIMSGLINVLDNTSEAVELAEKKYRKEIIKFGEWLYPNSQGKFVFDKDKASKVVRNFKNKVRKSLNMTRGHQSIKEIDTNPDVVAGEVEDLILTENGVDAIFSVNENTADYIGAQYKDVSIAIDEDL